MLKFTLTELCYLLELAKTRHFGKAAKLANVSQPALSIAINKLENKLGVAIFERNNLEVSLTEIGQQIVAQAKHALAEMQAIQTIADAGRCQLNTPLKIGAIYTIAPYVFPKLLPNLKRLAPDMPLIIYEDFSSNLKTKLQNGEIDAAIVSLPFEANSIVTKPLYKENFVCCVRADHILCQSEKISSEQLMQENILLLGIGHCFRDQVLQVCGHCYNSAGNTIVIDGASLETLKHMVASGLGVTILPQSAAAVSDTSGLLCTRPFADINPERTVALAWRVSYPRTKAIDILLQALPNKP
jgi:LysR family hydrogen peroxide-inducible transcriptional activator